MSVEERYRALVELSHEVTCLVDVERMSCTWVSPAVTEVLGHSVDEFMELGRAELQHPDDVAVLDDAIARVREHPGQPLTVRYRLRHKNGRWRWMEVTVANRLDHPALRAIVLNHRDITERRLLEERVQQAQKMDAIGRLAGGIAHDFNNMLSAISGFTNLAVASLRPGDPMRDELAEVLDAATRAAMLTRQLLAFSRQQLLQPRVFDLAAQVRKLEPMLRRAINEDIELTVTTPEQPVTVKADVAQIEQVLLNLVLNARDAMPVGGRLELSVGACERDAVDVRAFPEAQTGAHALLTVRDTGRGMTPEVRARIFEPFYTTRPGASHGLGLSSVYGIVTQSRGHLAVQSEPGVGTTFQVYLPISQEELQAEAPAPPLASPPRHETILLVEDEAAVRRYASRVLRSGGYNVLEAGSGREAIGLAGEHHGEIDLLFTDVVMPGMSGPQLAAKLSDVRPGLRVLYTSGYASSVIEQHGVLDERFDLVEKPIAPHALLAKVREMLDKPAVATS
jgi:two-component system, cell cycle sensor histidine kinase and response regulator CckA